MNAVIVSPHNDNIPAMVRLAQKEVMKTMTDIEFTQVLHNMTHAQAMDNIMSVTKSEVVLFMDIDCIPLNKHIIPTVIDYALKGHLVGNAQTALHIGDGSHVFVAPSFMALSRKLWLEMGSPSFEPTERSDVGGEITWKADQAGIPVMLLRPIHYEKSPYPVEMPDGRTFNPAYWVVNNIPFGLNTTFSLEWDADVFHSFQSSLVQADRFITKCSEVLSGVIKMG
jgi:hypothetical protein